MSVTPLKPGSLPALDVSNHDRIMSALNQAIEDQQQDQQLGQSARGVAIVWLREYPGGTMGNSWIIQGMNSIEAIGLLHVTADDISIGGLDNGPEHFPKEPA